MSKATLTVALAGNPNSGKTTIFNALTGERQHVGNYPGVTVEKKEGTRRHNDTRLDIIDLPGTYSLTAYSLEEIIARSFIIEEDPDVVVDIIDSSNLERNLYLATQLTELGVPLVLAFNKSDLARARGYSIDTKKLSQLLGVPIVCTVGHKQKGVDKLLDTVAAVGQDASAAVADHRLPNYGNELEPHVRQLQEMIRQKCGIERRCRWFAIKLLENDDETIKRLGRLCGGQLEDLLVEANRLRRHIESICGDAAEILLADRRYGFISGACTEAVKQTVEARHVYSDKIDAVITNRYLGLPIFAVMMYLVFQLTFSVGNPLVELLDGWKGYLAALVRGSSGEGAGFAILRSLLADGIIEGVGAVLTFLPLIALLYLAISLLEDSGYMARAAFILDRLMHKIGLHGKSFIPMLIGFGCTVPAVMATRILESRRDRLTTMLVLPLMSCAARLPIYVLILGAFFPAHSVFSVFGVAEVTNQALLPFAIYLTGIALAIACTKLLRVTILRGEVTPFVMELPPYRVPVLKGLLVHMWERSWLFVKKAGTIILAITIVLWALGTWPTPGRQETQQFVDQRIAAQGEISSPAGLEERLHEIDLAEHQAELATSAIGRIGKFVAPALQPCGFDWKISTGLLGSLAAKEVFISQMGIIYAAGEATETLQEKLTRNYTPLQGFCIMLFVLISSPCVATVAVTVRESGSWKWALFQWAGLTAMAWLITAAVYQIGTIMI